MATNKRRTPAERVQALLTKQKYRTEAEVLERVKGATRPMIRAVRRDLGIDRTSCLADIRRKLATDPKWPGTAAISYALRHYGIQLGAPDVSRLRSKGKSPDKDAALKGAGFKTMLMPVANGIYRCGACGVGLNYTKKKGAKKP